METLRRRRESEIICRALSLFELKETELRPDCRVIELEGELDLAVAGDFEDSLERATGYRVVLIDLSGCEFLDSTGIAAVVRAHRDFADEGRMLATFGAEHQVLRVLSLTGLTENGLVFEDAEQALEALQQSQPQ
jgi:anti-sigma B factor antagonist